MRGVFDDEGFQPAQPRRDTELTLGSGTLLAIFFGLVLVCGLCFGLGYAVGRHGAAPPVAGPQPAAAEASMQPDGSRPKPSATAQPAVTQSATPQTYAAGQPQSTPSDAAPAANPQTPYPAAPAASSSGPPQVRPALAPAASAPQPAAAQTVHPALPPATPLMVQIAAVANPEDGQVLVNALKKRGYTVTVRREPEDNLIHVRIGPFSTRDEANRWRQKLLNDGYNAIVMP
jgi:DedD protein